ncbi:unnamed protein product [Ilex paraguariensis]|uniref:Cupin-like domain-containing protein n=1 Tax=Ilex paraguariensis TaxID=185542 RepID=A0ABC8QX59_9AQUA
MEEESLRIRRYEEIPSVEEFSSQIEPKNVPAVFSGCIKNWKAFCNWNPSNGGLDYLEERVGSSTVEAMLSKSAPVFDGAIRNHERVPLPFSTFIGYCWEIFQNQDNDICLESERHGLAGSNIDHGGLLSGNAHQQLYLAQVPIMNVENEERNQLERLREDIETILLIKSYSLHV